MSALRLDVPARGGAELAVTPRAEEVAALAGRHGQVPLVHTFIADCETPVSAFLKLRDDGPCFLLESAEEGQRLGRYSMIGIRPQAVIRGVDDQLAALDDQGTVHPLDGTDPFRAAQDYVEGVGMGPAAEPLAFHGGAVGFFGYDLVRRVEHLPGTPPDDRGIPDLALMVTGPVVQFDHLRRSLTLVVPCRLDRRDPPEVAYERALAELRELKATLAGPVPPSPGAHPDPEIGPIQSNTTREAFEAAVERVKEYVFAGDAFQVVPSQRFAARMSMDPFSVYRGLRTVNPSPYMFFLDFGDVALVGSSPEMLVKVTGRTVETRPIAGTRPRGETITEDRRLADELLGDPKERAEHVMLVDLGRNDIGRVARPGTVAVKELMGVHMYSHVMHIESSVVGELAQGMSSMDALRAAFPAGTLSGAPKVRAMEIIDELEPTKRGPYGGAVGYLGFDGDLDTCITIRTIVCHNGTAYVQAGAGVVADSVPSTEFAETENKAAAMFTAIEVAAAQADWP
jgi:anthranilate synthase component 1